MKFASIVVSAAICFSSLSGAWAAKIEPRTPNPEITPGHLCSKRDPDFDGYRYKERIPYCERNVSQALKNAVYEAYSVPVNKRQNYTIDHFIPLSIGGSNAFENLWPEHKKLKEKRLFLELDTYLELERGEITQKEAIRRITEAKMNPPVSFVESDE